MGRHKTKKHSQNPRKHLGWDKSLGTRAKSPKQSPHKQQQKR